MAIAARLWQARLWEGRLWEGRTWAGQTVAGQTVAGQTVAGQTHTRRVIRQRGRHFRRGVLGWMPADYFLQLEPAHMAPMKIDCQAPAVQQRHGGRRPHWR